MFVRKSVRLCTDIGRTYKYFTQPEMLAKWFVLEEGMTMKQIDCERERMIVFECVNQTTNQQTRVEVNLMMCRPRTEFCTEIHVIHHMEDLEHKEFYETFWKANLERLRVIFNKDWVIEEKDLTLGILQGSRI